MNQAKPGDRVQVLYTGKFNNGEVFDASTDDAPLDFTIGQGEIIPGFEQGIIGMKEGESRVIHILPDEAYGQHDEELLYEVDRIDIPEDMELEVGREVEMSDEDGHTFPAVITHVGEETIEVDANHPLAGKELTFEIKLVAVDRPPL